jgi:polyisoprenyl-phosphate glycosyltransferase
MRPEPPDSAAPRAPEVSVVVPVYDIAQCLEALVQSINAALGRSGHAHEVVLVNDGSADRSWSVIEGLCGSHAHVVGIDLRRNFGQDNAILTGLRVAHGRAVVIMDDDLQHDPADIPRLLARLDEGADVVYADFRVRHHVFWKTLGSWFNGKIAEWVIDKPKGVYLSPYKAMRREVADLICGYDGPDPYVDGLLFQVTSRFAQVPAEHHPRFAGSSTYTLRKSVAVWARLATSFSVRPLRMVTWCGLALGALGGLLALYVIVYRLLFPNHFAVAVAGWASLIVAQLLIGGVQMVFLGILGEYAGRTHSTVAGKPQATIRTVLNAARLPGSAAPVHDDLVKCGR